MPEVHFREVELIFCRQIRSQAVLIFILILVTILDFLGEWFRGQVTKKIHTKRSPNP